MSQVLPISWRRTAAALPVGARPTNAIVDSCSQEHQRGSTASSTLRIWLDKITTEMMTDRGLALGLWERLRAGVRVRVIERGLADSATTLRMSSWPRQIA